jgi:copper-binding protein NosD
MKVLSNTVEGFTIGIWSSGDSNVIKANQVLAVSAGIILNGSGNEVKRNSLMGINWRAILYDCTSTGNTVTHNFINDAPGGIEHSSSDGNIVNLNTYSNVQTIVGPPCR